MTDSEVVTVAFAGAGSRGSAYAGWIRRHPDRARVVAVAEPRREYRDALAADHGLAPERQYDDWRQLLAAGPRAGAAGRIADLVVIATRDDLHLEPALAFIEAGYDVLLEKPIAPTEDECRRIVAAAEASGRLFGVCHVLRYTPYTETLKRALDTGLIGDVVSVQHLEPVGYWHQAHSFVRGNWRQADQSSFMLLAKSCHDLDWLRYVVGRPITRVSSFGGLAHFTRANQPAGAAERCFDCAVEPDCAYSAPKIYAKAFAERGGRAWPIDVITKDPTREGVERALRDGPYGRCVYACDNDVVDHQVVNLEFEGGVSAVFTMTAFAAPTRRRTRIFGTRGELEGDSQRVRVYDFLTDAWRDVEPATSQSSGGTHGGGDDGLMDAFIRAVATRDASWIRSGATESLNSHLAVFAAERSRREGTVVSIAG